MNRYRKGANCERQAVLRHIKNGAIFAGRFAGSKCKGRLKVDVVALYPGQLVLEQYKKTTQSVAKERRQFISKILPENVRIVRNFVQL